jgi:hypothetical protein
MRELTPLWVWLTFGLMSVDPAWYMVGYLVIDDFLHSMTKLSHRNGCGLLRRCWP